MDESFYFALPLNEDAHRTMYGLENYLVEVEHSQSDTFNFDCAIIVFPTTDQIGYLKNIEKDLFDETMKDNSKYYDLVKRWIDSSGVTVVSVTSEYLKLIGTSQTWNLALRKKNLPPWNLIFFKTNRGPMIVPPADLSDNLIKDYFGGK